MLTADERVCVMQSLRLCRAAEQIFDDVIIRAGDRDSQAMADAAARIQNTVEALQAIADRFRTTPLPVGSGTL